MTTAVSSSAPQPFSYQMALLKSIGQPLSPSLTSAKTEVIKSDAKVQKTVQVTKVVHQQIDQTLTSHSVLDSFDEDNFAYRPNPTTFFKKYNGKINAICKKPQYVLIQDVKEKILFSQQKISDSNYNNKDNCDYPLDDLADSLFIKFKKDIERVGDGALDIVNMGNGYFTSVDNRRLLIAKKIGAVDRCYGIWVRVHDAGDALSEGLQRRFGGATTWGAAVNGRISNAKVIGYTTYPKIMATNTDGSRVEAQSQQISLSISCSLSQLNKKDMTSIQNNKKNGIILI